MLTTRKQLCVSIKGVQLDGQSGDWNPIRTNVKRWLVVRYRHVILWFLHRGTLMSSRHALGRKRRNCVLTREFLNHEIASVMCKNYQFGHSQIVLARENLRAVCPTFTIQ